MSSLWLRSLVLVLAIAQAIAPSLAGVTGHGRPIGQSEGAGGVETPLVPAGYAFSIWGVIFLGCLALAIAWLLPGRSDHRAIAIAAPWVAGAFLLCTLWSIVAQYGDVRFTVPIFIALLTCLLLGLRGYVAAGGAHAVVTVPLAVYAGWSSVAIFANISTTIVRTTPPSFGLSPLFASLTLLIAASVVGAVIAVRVWSNWWTFGAAAWALLAIAVVNFRNLGAGGLREVAVAAIAGIVVLAVATAAGRARTVG